jgi:hypothetical protein
MARAGADPLAGHSRYRTVGSLGAGAFGSVVLAENGEGQKHAVKLLKRSDVNKYVSAEILNHANLWHPHVSRQRRERVAWQEAASAPRAFVCCCALSRGAAPVAYPAGNFADGDVHQHARAHPGGRASRMLLLGPPAPLAPARRSSSSWRCS